MLKKCFNFKILLIVLISLLLITGYSLLVTDVVFAAIPDASISGCGSINYPSVFYAGCDWNLNGSSSDIDGFNIYASTDGFQSYYTSVGASTRHIDLSSLLSSECSSGCDFYIWVETFEGDEVGNADSYSYYVLEPPSAPSVTVDDIGGSIYRVTWSWSTVSYGGLYELFLDPPIQSGTPECTSSGGSCSSETADYTWLADRDSYVDVESSDHGAIAKSDTTPGGSYTPPAAGCGDNQRNSYVEGDTSSGACDGDLGSAWGLSNGDSTSGCWQSGSDDPYLCCGDDLAEQPSQFSVFSWGDNQIDWSYGGEVCCDRSGELPATACVDQYGNCHIFDMFDGSASGLNSGGNDNIAYCFHGDGNNIGRWVDCDVFCDDPSVYLSVPGGEEVGEYTSSEVSSGKLEACKDDAGEEYVTSQCNGATVSELCCDNAGDVIGPDNTCMDECPVPEIAPTVDSLSANPDNICLGESTTISWTSSDTGGVGIDRVEVWHDNGSGWSQISSGDCAGNQSEDGSCSGFPTVTTDYGVHVIDNNGNCIAEDGSHCGGISSDSLDPRSSYGPDTVTVSDCDAPTGSIDSISSDDCSANVDVNLDWSAADTGGSGLDRLEVWRRVNGGGWNEVAGCRDESVSGNSANGSCVHNVACGNDGNLYEYGLHIFDNAYPDTTNMGTEDEIKSTTVNCPAAAPSNFTQDDAGQDFVEFSWTDNADNEEQFYIYRMPSWSPWGYNSANDTDYYDVNQMVCGTDYNYLISAYDDVCGESDYLDDYASTLDCTGPYFTLVVSPDSRTIDCGDNTDYNVVLQAHNGFSDNITLSIDGCPSGSTCDFELNPVPPTSNTKLSITNARYSSTLTVTGIGGGHQASDDVDLNVNDGLLPNVNALSVNNNAAVELPGQTSFTTTDTSLDIDWIVQDFGCSILSQSEVWYKVDGGSWQEEVPCRDTSYTDQGPANSSCTHNVTCGHTYEYGIHVTDTADNLGTETTSGLSTVMVNVSCGGPPPENEDPTAGFSYCRQPGENVYVLEFTNESEDPDVSDILVYQWDFDSTDGVDLPANPFNPPVNPNSIEQDPIHDYVTNPVAYGKSKTRISFLGQWADQGVIAGVSEQSDESETEKITFWQKIGNFFSNIWNNIKGFFKNIFQKTAKAQVSVPSFGDGSDGSITINSSKNLNTDDISTADGDSTADGVVSAVSDIDNNDVTVNSASGFSAGDKVLLINMQGSSSKYANVGTYEFLEIDSINSNEIIFTSNVQNTYGENNNSSLSGQLIVLQRVPEYTDVTIQNNGVLTSSTWNGGRYGVLAFYVSGTLDVQSGGKIDVDAIGSRPGSGESSNNRDGRRGEGEQGGHNTRTTSALGTAGGGGDGNKDIGGGDTIASGGGGGGHAINGTDGEYYDSYWGSVNNNGVSVGTQDLSNNIFMGGAGGGGGTDDNGGESSRGGGAGGGIVIIYANTLTINGNIYTRGEDGDITTWCSDDGCGGGGAGGSILMVSNTATLGSSRVVGTGGSGGNLGGCIYDGPGGNGSAGRIHLMAVSYTGTTNPTLYFTQLEQSAMKVTLYVDDNRGGTDIKQELLPDFNTIELCAELDVSYNFTSLSALSHDYIAGAWEKRGSYSNGSDYAVYRCQGNSAYCSSSSNYFEVDVNLTKDCGINCTFDNTGLTENTEYYYYITTPDDELNNSTASPNCTGGYQPAGLVCPLGDTTDLEPDVVTGLTVDRHCGYLTINWDNVGVAYKLYKCIDKSDCLNDDDGYSKIYEGSDTTYPDDEIIPINVINPNDDNYYCYKVISQAESGGDWGIISDSVIECEFSYCYRAPNWTER